MKHNERLEIGLVKMNYGKKHKVKVKKTQKH